MFNPISKKGLMVATVAFMSLVLTGCAGGGGNGGTNNSGSSEQLSEASTDFSYDWDSLRKQCESPKDVKSYLPDLPGPTTTAPGLAFTDDLDNTDDVLKATEPATVKDAVSSPEALAYWAMIDLRLILNKDTPLNVYNVKQWAKLFRNDESLRVKTCQRLVDQLRLGASSAKLVSLKEPRALGYWVYTQNFKSGVWVCDRQVPADGVTMLEWDRTYSEEKDDPISGDTVIIDPLRRAIVTTTCPADAVEGNLVGEQDAPAANQQDQQPAGSATKQNNANTSKAGGGSKSDKGTTSGKNGGGGSKSDKGTTSGKNGGGGSKSDKGTTSGKNGGGGSKSDKGTTSGKAGGGGSGGSGAGSGGSGTGGTGGTDAGNCGASCGAGGGGTGGDTGTTEGGGDGCGTGGCGGESSAPSPTPTKTTTPKPSPTPSPKPTPTKTTPSPTPTPTKTTPPATTPPANPCDTYPVPDIPECKGPAPGASGLK